MNSITSKIAFHILNKHQAKLAGMTLPDARRHFDKISRVPRITSTKRATDETAGQVRIRIYRATRVAPTILYFHGGGFVLGSLDSHDVVARVLCKAAKCTVVSVDYRLAPKHQYPAAIDDGLTVLRWLQTIGIRLLPSPNL
jgi:acetyl esterase